MINAMGTFTICNGSRNELVAAIVDIRHLQRRLSRAAAELTLWGGLHLRRRFCGVYLSLLASRAQRGKNCAIGKILRVRGVSSAPTGILRYRAGPTGRSVKLVELAYPNHSLGPPGEISWPQSLGLWPPVYYLESRLGGPGAPALSTMIGQPWLSGRFWTPQPGRIASRRWKISGPTAPRRGWIWPRVQRRRDCGPQSSSLIISRRPLIGILLISHPASGRMFRWDGKEMVGLYSALKQFLARTTGP